MQTSFMSKKGWLAGNQDTVSEWSDMSTHGPLFQCPDS